MSTTYVPESVSIGLSLDGPIPLFDLKAWRTERLRRVKQRPEYARLSQLQRRIVDFLVRAHESPDEGIIVRHSKIAAHFNITREWCCKQLIAIERAEVFVKESRSRGRGRGRTSNRYRLNPLLLSSEATYRVKAVHSVSSLCSSQHEVSLRETDEAVPTGLHLEEGHGGSSSSLGTQTDSVSIISLAETPASSMIQTAVESEELKALRDEYAEMLGVAPIDGAPAEHLRACINHIRVARQRRAGPVWR